MSTTRSASNAGKGKDSDAVYVTGKGKEYDSHVSATTNNTNSVVTISMSDVEKFFDKALDRALDKASLAFELKIKTLFNDRLAVVEESIETHDERIKELETSVNICNVRIFAMEQKLTNCESAPRDVTPAEHNSLKKMVHETMCDVNDLEQYGRRYNIRIFGLDVKENYIENVATFIRDNLSMDLSPIDVENAHPLPYRC